MEDWLLLGSAEYYKLKTLEASTCSFPLGTKVYYNSDCPCTRSMHACWGRKREGLDEGWSVPTCAAGAEFQKRADHGYVCGIEDLRAVL